MATLGQGGAVTTFKKTSDNTKKEKTVATFSTTKRPTTTSWSHGRQQQCSRDDSENSWPERSIQALRRIDNAIRAVDREDSRNPGTGRTELAIAGGCIFSRSYEGM